jgi:membrane protease YdiL (CAAX protease family)
MATATATGELPTDLKAKVTLRVCALVAYASGFWPNSLVLKYGGKALGYPPYQGFVGAFLPHLLLYSTLPALICAILWWVLSRNRLIMPIPLGNVRASLPIGLAVGLLSVLLTLVLAWAIMPAGTIHWIDPQPWKIAGNIFSNFFEEFIFRGFILIALAAVIGFWPAAIASSVMWAAMHTQYPIEFQALIAFSGVLWGWAGRRVRSLWAPYTAHMTLDLIADCLIG